MIWEGFRTPPKFGFELLGPKGPGFWRPDKTSNPQGIPLTQALKTSDPAIYVITYHEFNHGSLRPGKNVPLDSRFLENDNNYIYYLIDKKVPQVLSNKKTILEYEMDANIHVAGSKFFGEWSFLLNEEKNAFCQYPFFMISSRFYEKNAWLRTNLNTEWDKLFHYLKEYGYGYLPSYDRPLRWINLEWEKDMNRKAWEYKFFPFTRATYQVTKEVFGISIPQDYRFTADLFCNYIGFQSRDELKAYVQFYRPLLDYFFDSSLSLKRDLAPYVRTTNAFRNEKSFTFFLEFLSHLFFFQNKKKFFALHYDGYYSIDESRKKIKRLEKFAIPLKIRCKRFIRWQGRRMKSEGCLAPLMPLLRKYKIFK